MIHNEAYNWLHKIFNLKFEEQKALIIIFNEVAESNID